MTVVFVIGVVALLCAIAFDTFVLEPAREARREADKRAWDRSIRKLLEIQEREQQ